MMNETINNNFSFANGCHSPRTLSPIKNYIHRSIKYLDILYLLLKNDFTYTRQLRELFKISDVTYLINLKRDNYVVERVLTLHERDKLKLINPFINDKNLDRLRVFELTNEAILYLSETNIYSLIEQLCNKDIIDAFIREQYDNYSKSIIERDKKKLEQEIKERPLIDNCIKWIKTITLSKNYIDEEYLYYRLEKLKFKTNIINKSIKMLINNNYLKQLNGGYERNG